MIRRPFELPTASTFRMAGELPLRLVERTYRRKFRWSGAVFQESEQGLVWW